MTIPGLNEAYPNLKKFIDVEDGLKRIRNNKKLYTMIMNSFLADTHLGELQQQIENGDSENAAKTAHLIKGLVGNLSLTAAYDMCVSIEAQLKSGGDASAALVEMLEVFDSTIEDINIVLGVLPDLEV